MVDQPRCYLVELPPHRAYGGSAPPRRQPQQFQRLKEIIGNYSYPEEERIGISFPTGHPVHAKAILKLFDAVFHLTTLIMETDYLPGRLLSVGSDNVLAVRVWIE